MTTNAGAADPSVQGPTCCAMAVPGPSRAAMAEHEAGPPQPVEGRLGTASRAPAAMAGQPVAGQMPGRSVLPTGPHLAIPVGEGNWTKFLEHPPPGALEAALTAAKARVEEEWPL